MQFPRINSAINLTLLYYDKHQIVLGVGQYSKSIQRAGITFQGKLLPHWDTLVLQSHQAMEEEIQQIISLNYPYVRDIVFENLREVLNDVRIRELNKDLIIKIADENNEAEHKRILDYPKGFMVLIDKDFLQQYFALVENAISNLKRIINKYLKLYDAGKLPQQPFSQLLPANTTPIIKDSKPQNTRIKVNISVEELTMLFRLLKEEKIIISRPRHDHEIHEFIVHHFETIGMEDSKISVKNVGRHWSSTNPDVLTFWIKTFTDLIERAQNK